MATDLEDENMLGSTKKLNIVLHSACAERFIYIYIYIYIPTRAHIYIHINQYIRTYT